MLRVNCMEPDEIVALVELLRDWKLESGAPVRVAVTADTPWAGLREDDVVPREGETPTTLRNVPGMAVVLVEYQPYSDQQSWQCVRAISDAGLLADRRARDDLSAFLLRREPPRLLRDVLESVFGVIGSVSNDPLPVRDWIAFVDTVCEAVASHDLLDAAKVWEAVGKAFPTVRLFPDDVLASQAETDRQRRLKANLADSRRLLKEADDRWRDVLQERVGDAVFHDMRGEPERDQETIRTAITRFLAPDGESEQKKVLFRHWRELSEARAPRAGLGTRIREYLSEDHSARVEEYDHLGVTQGIDDASADDAQKLLDDLPEDENVRPLVRLLNNKQVAALERIANPRAPTTSAPLSEIVRVAAEMVDDRLALAETGAQLRSAALVIEPRRVVAEAEHSRALFAWLFGCTLRRAAEQLDGEILSLDVHETLDSPRALSGFEREVPDDEADDSSEGAFGTLELRLRWSDDVGSERRVDWAPRSTPGLVALWRICGHAEVPTWMPEADVPFDGWLSSALDRSPMLGGLTPTGDSPEVVRAWRERRASTLRALGASGLEVEPIREYVDAYCTQLAELRDRHVPAGAARADVAEILRCDLFLDDREVALLASHPIRLRWIAAYQDRLRELLCKTLRSEFVVNPVNPSLFFRELLAVSPQSQPPVAVMEDRLYLAVREQGWHERLAPLKDEQGERREWLADLDDGAIDEVAGNIGRYLEAYPHKADGLHILYIVRRQGARGLHRLVAATRKLVRVREAPLVLTLFVEQEEVRAVEEVMQDFDDADYREHSDRPPLIVRLHHWESPDAGLPDVSALEPFVDIAVVPNLFGASTRTHDGTRDGRQDPGKFDPLLDQPTRLESVGAGDALSSTVSRVLLPEGTDTLLEAWSTVTTRQFRGFPVSEAPDQHDVDHVLIQVSLEKNRSFFDALHACAHWVITLDAFVGREQVEALENGPDVIRVLTGVGANGAYRMVVSSTAGRVFVESRVARRLRDQIPSAVLADTGALATAIYDRARLLVPGIVLRSLGLGRTAAEMVGLVMARARVEQADPAYVGPHGFQSWLSLDEHLEWSGGHNAVRADLVRLRGWLVGQELHVAVDVVEAKMRTQLSIGRADRQISRSVELLRCALGQAASNEAESAPFADAPMWWRLLWRAVEQTSTAADATPAATHVVTPEGRRTGLDERLRSALRQGAVVVESVAGTLVSMIEGDVGFDTHTPEGHRWLRMTHEEARDLLVRLSDDADYPLRDRIEVDREASPSLSTSAMRTQARPALSQVAESAIGSAPEPSARGGATDAATRRMQDLLDALYQRNVDVSPADAEDAALEGPGFYLLRVRLGSDVRPQTVFALTDDLQYHLELDAGQQPRMYVDRGTVVVEVPKREEERYYVDAAELWRRTEWPADRLYAPIGCDVRDRPIGIDFSSSNSPHLLVGGMTGGGKSVALETLLMGLVRHYSADQLTLRIIDPKGNEFTEFEQLAHLSEPPGMDAEDAIEMLEATCAEMDQRYRAMKELSRARGERVRDLATYNSLVAPTDRLRWIVVVLDEFADLTADRENKRTIEGLLQRIAQKARACGIHAIVATQKPSAEVISTTTRSNLGAQLALRVRSATDSRVIMEVPGAESLAGNGDAFLRLSGQEPIRLQCAQVQP